MFRFASTTIDLPRLSWPTGAATAPSTTTLGTSNSR
jgi:hypothetical protein